MSYKPSGLPFEARPAQVCPLHRSNPLPYGCSACDLIATEATDNRRRAQASLSIISTASSNRADRDRVVRNTYDKMNEDSISAYTSYYDRAERRQESQQRSEQGQREALAFAETTRRADAARERIKARDSSSRPDSSRYQSDSGRYQGSDFSRPERRYPRGYY